MQELIQEAGLDLRNPRAEGFDKVEALLRESDKKGIWLAAPSPLAIDQDQDVTIYGFDYYANDVRGRRYLSESGVIVGTRVESRESFASLLEEQKELADPNEEVDTTPLPHSLTVQQFRVALRERLVDLPWRSGTYLVDVMLDAQLSNRLEFRITAGKAAERDPEVAAFIEQQRAAADTPKDLYPAPSDSGYPNFKKTADSLEVPEKEGIRLSADRVSVFKPGSSAVLRGSFRLPVPAAYYREGAAEEGAATAAVPITLVITGNLMTGPFVAPLRVATYDKVDKSRTESTVTGYFEIDLFALKETSKVPQTYTIWAYSGAVRSESATAAFITPEMLK